MEVSMTTLIIIFFTGLAGGFQGAVLEGESVEQVVANTESAEGTELAENTAADEGGEEVYGEEHLLSNAIQVEPKIVSDIMYVSLAYSFGEEVRLELYDVLGVRVRSVVMTGPRVSVDVSTLPQGVYFLYASLGQDQRAVKRVIIH
jgi:hypothetical protein